MSAALRDSLIARLLDATPWPPETEDANVLIAAANAMMTARAPVLAEVTERLGACDELALRQAAWDRKMSEARDALAEKRTNLARARRAYR